MMGAPLGGKCVRNGARSIRSEGVLSERRAFRLLAREPRASSNLPIHFDRDAARRAAAPPSDPGSREGFPTRASALSPRGLVPLSAELVFLKTAYLPALRLRMTLRICEFYFDVDPPTGSPHTASTDVHAGYCLKQAPDGWLAYPTSTRLIDLTATPDLLFGDCSKTHRYEIERARRSDDIQIDLLVHPRPQDVSEFIGYYDVFAASKGIPSIARDHFNAMAKAGKLATSLARDRDRNVLAASAYIVVQDRARLTHSASLFRLQASSAERNRIGRANRLLHWESIIGFQELGLAHYDMGGWYTGDRDEALLRINSFKKGFGGKVVHEWNAFRSLSVRGWAYVRARDLVHRARKA
jgi:hypothetical protein